jgi:hypothetical protein
VVYSPGNRDYQSAYMTRAGQSDAESPLPRGLFIAVAVLGLATYAFSFGPVVNGGGATGWNVRFAALAALCAGFSLLRKHKPLPMATAVLAATGFLDALSSQLLATDPGWAMSVIVALNAVQAVAATAALLMWPEPTSADTSTTGYESYVDYYNQAVRNHYSQQAQSPPQQQTQRAGYGQASADAQAAAQAHRGQRVSQHGDYSDFVSPQGNHGRPAQAASPPSQPSPAPQPGRQASFGPAQPSTGQQEMDADQSAWPSSS